MTSNQPLRSKCILIISNLFALDHRYGGVCKELAARLIKNGWQVTTTSSVSSRFLRPLDMVATICLKRQNYHVAQIDVFSGFAFCWAELSAWALGLLHKPYILTLHGGNLPIFAEKRANRLQKLIMGASVVTTPSSYIQSSFTPIRQDILLLSNPIELSNYHFRHRFQPSPKIAWLRAFHSTYNPKMVVGVVALLRESFPNIEVTMFGPDKKDGSLQIVQTFSKTLNVDKNIQIPGPIPNSQVPVLLAPYDIFLNTTTVESFGVSVMEAAALGMCIVSTDVGELPYIWTHEHDALLVQSGDAEAMANAVRRILTEPGLAARLSRNARATAEKYDWSTILPRWESLLIEVIERHNNV